MEVTSSSSSSSASSSASASIASTTTAVDTLSPESFSSSLQPFYAVVLDSGPIIKHSHHLESWLRGLVGDGDGDGDGRSSSCGDDAASKTTTTTFATHFVTVPGVVTELRDGKARQWLESLSSNNGGRLPFLQIRQPSPQSVQAVIQFAKQTGDYPSLSHVDVQVLALTYQMEVEGYGCIGGNSSSINNNNNIPCHIRTTPKRTIGLGTIQLLSSLSSSSSSLPSNYQLEKKKNQADTPASATTDIAKSLDVDYDVVVIEDEDEGEEGQEEREGKIRGNNKNDDDADDNAYDDYRNDDRTTIHQPSLIPSSSSSNKSDVINIDEVTTTATNTTTTPTLSSATLAATTRNSNGIESSYINEICNNSTNQVVYRKLTESVVDDDDDSNNLQYTLASDGGGGEIGKFDDATDDNDDGGSGGDTSSDIMLAPQVTTVTTSNDSQSDLELEFPTLQMAAKTVFQGEDSEHDQEIPSYQSINNTTTSTTHTLERTTEEKRKNLQPISKSGKLYNSFRNYRDLMKPKKISCTGATVSTNSTKMRHATNNHHQTNELVSSNQPTASKITGSGGIMTLMAETMEPEDDDGAGWVTSSQHIETLKTHGQLDPSKSTVLSTAKNHHHCNTAPIQPAAVDANQDNIANPNTNVEPPLSQRAACATTDFAMQNVLLQMNLVVLSVDGMRIRRLKSWVLRCGACFKIHHSPEDQEFLDGRMKRLFCSHCGSDMLQRIAASVDGKTGRLKLHFSKRRQGKHLSIRGTKYSLPKPGRANKYQGELLLREDQLLMGAWNQKVKIRSGNTYQTSSSESIFGRDLASTVGCNVTKITVGRGGRPFGSSTWTGSTSISAYDIQVGFGARNNPNSAKGRERRGKKKKSTDRACGMRRY
jgi:RNA-binding protein NOB1